MGANIPKLREQLALFDSAEVQRKLTKAQLKVRGEARLPEIRMRYDIDATTALLILDEAVAVSEDDDEVAFALEGIAASWAGEGEAWAEAARRVDRRHGEEPVSLVHALGQVNDAVAQVMGSGLSSRR